MPSLHMSAADPPEEKSLFERLYLSYRDKMYNIAFCVLKNADDAEDAVHDAFVKLFGKADLLSGMTDELCGYYLCSAVRNTAISKYKKRKNSGIAEKSVDDMYDLSGGSVEEEVFSSYGVEQIKAALARLSDKDYELIFLTAYMGRTPADIAALYGESAGKVRQKLRRARKRLSKLLDEEETTKKEARSYV